MPTAIALIRGINVGGRNSLPMAELRALCEGLGLENVATYIQSGNVLFQADAKAMPSIGIKLEKAIESARRFRPTVIVRSLADLQRAAANHPLASTPGADGSRLLIMFLAASPAATARRAVASLDGRKDRVVLIGAEAYLHFPDGVSKSKPTMADIERALATPGTCRNLNTLERLVQMGRKLEETARKPG